jgi:hypothetical protein
MFNIPGLKGNANQNHIDSPSLLLECLSSREQTTTNVGEVLEEVEFSYTVGGNVNYYSHYGKQYGGSQKAKNTTAV